LSTQTHVPPSITTDKKVAAPNGVNKSNPVEKRQDLKSDHAKGGGTNKEARVGRPGYHRRHSLSPEDALVTNHFSPAVREAHCHYNHSKSGKNGQECPHRDGVRAASSDADH
jgi:hypothetical protein